MISRHQIVATGSKNLDIDKVQFSTFQCGCFLILLNLDWNRFPQSAVPVSLMKTSSNVGFPKRTDRISVGNAATTSRTNSCPLWHSMRNSPFNRGCRIPKSLAYFRSELFRFWRINDNNISTDLRFQFVRCSDRDQFPFVENPHTVTRFGILQNVSCQDNRCFL